MNVSSKNTFYNLYGYDNKAAYDNKAVNDSSKENVSKEDVVKEMVEKLQEDLKMAGFKSEEEKERYQKKINEKIQLGEELTEKEMSFLQRTNPHLYMRVKRIQMQREMLHNQLKHCRSKKEVEEAYNQAMTTISEKDPDRQLVMKAYDNVTREFKRTNQYKALPQDVKDKEGNKGNKGNKGKVHVKETERHYNVKC